jgi:hypothetical protein
MTEAPLVRDTVDQRAINNIRNRTGTLIDSQDEVGDWDPYPMERRPNQWEVIMMGCPITGKRATA